MSGEMQGTSENEQAIKRATVREGVARRWKWPVWFGVWCGGAATVFAFACPAMMGRDDRLTLAATQAACMLRTFGLQAGVGCVVIALLVWAAGLRRAAVWVVVVGAVWLVPEGWKFARPAPGVGVGAGAGAGQETLTVISVNALYGRSSIEAIEREAVACGADVVVFQEFTPGLEGALRMALRDYPHRVAMARDDAFGQAVFSKRPFVGTPEVYPTRPRWSSDPQISVTVEFDGGLVRVTDIHLYPPVGLSAVSEQRRQVVGLAEDVRASLLIKDVAGRRVERIVAGDFNGTPDGHIVKAITPVMVDSWAEGSRGRGGTWPADGVLSGLGKIRIDNLLHSGGLVCVAAGVGGETGSDHLPTWARYVRRR